MGTHRVIFTKRSITDLSRIADFLEQDSPQLARRVGDELIAAAKSLSNLPARFRQVGVSRKRNLPVHWLVCDPYLIYYRIDAANVYVLRIRHGRQRRLKRFD
jgi:plasmid stabilization system protein ParE